jgi:hypothetical protein
MMTVWEQYRRQCQQAANQALLDHARLLAEGYVEVMPGVLRHPDGTEVRNAN